MENKNLLDDIKIMHFRLSDGYEVIAHVTSSSDANFITERPMLINSIHNDGYDTYFFTKFMPFSENNLVKINTRNIIAICDVSDDIKEKYIRAATGTHETKEYSDLSEEDVNLNMMESPSKKLH